MTELLRERYRGLYRLVRKRGFSNVDAEEIMADSAAAVSKRLVEKGPVRGELVAYFTTTVNNQMKQRIRDESRTPGELLDMEVLAVRPAGQVTDEDLDKTLRSHGEQARLRAARMAVDQLSPYLKDPYELEVYAGLRPKEIARILRKKPETVRPYLSLARELVKAKTAELLRADEDHREGGGR